MATRVVQPLIPQGNYWAGLKSFADRGGFVNGLNPSIIGTIWYVNANTDKDRASRTGPVGSDGNNGLSPLTPFATVARAFEFVQSYDIIVIDGVIREQITAPLGVFDVTVIGAANLPRQATSAGLPTGGGATWLAPTSPVAATPLLTLREAGWSIQNIFFSGPTDAACVQLNRAEDAVNPDASHASFYGNVFGGGLYGIQDVGGNAFLKIQGNVFQNLTGATAYAIRNTSTAIAVPLQWEVIGNLFRNNKNHILAPISQGKITGNDFGIVGNSITAIIALSLTGGLNNSVYENYLNRPANTSPNATLYVGGTNDLWYQNYGTDAVIYGVPDNS